MYNKDYCLLTYVLSVILIIITLLVVSVTGQVIEFDPSLNDTIYIEVCTYVVANVVTLIFLHLQLKCIITLQLQYVSYNYSSII